MYSTSNEFDIKRGKSSSGRTMNGQWSNIQATSNQYKARTLILGVSAVCISGSAESISELPNTDTPKVAKSSSGSRIRQTRPIRFGIGACVSRPERDTDRHLPLTNLCLACWFEHTSIILIESNHLNQGKRRWLILTEINLAAARRQARGLFHALPTSRPAVPNQSCCHVRSAGPRASSPGASPLALRAPGAKLLASGSDSPAAPGEVSADARARRCHTQHASSVLPAACPSTVWVSSPT